MWITIVVILGVLNLLMGFFLTVYAETITARLVAMLPVSDINVLPPVQPLPQVTELPPPAPAPPEPVTTPDPFDAHSLPRAWRRLLNENRITPFSTLEALLWTFKLELSIFRGKLVNLESQLRTADHPADDNHPADNHGSVIASWRANHLEWSAQLDEFAKELTGVEQHAPPGPIMASLHDVLMDHQFDAHQTDTALKLMSESSGHDANPTATNNSGTLRTQLAEQINDSYSIRDRVDDLLATYLRESGRLCDTDESLQIEGATEIYNRIGFEIIFQQWLLANPDGEQPVTCMFVDIDRFSQKNDRFGNEVGDIIIAAFGGLLKSLIRVERGFDRVARFDGHSYALFLGNTTLENANVVAERTRQCIEATSFKVGGESFDVTTSLGLMEFDPKLSMSEFYRSVREAVMAAKNAGRNRTCLMRATGTEIAATATIQVTGRVIEIGGRG